MTQPVRLRLSRRKGFRLQEHSRAVNGLPAVNVGRPLIWGNPFVAGAPSGFAFEDGGDPAPMIEAMSSEQVIDFYENLCRGMLSPEMHPHGHRWLTRFRGHHGHPWEAIRSRLRGHNLACWCAPDATCHADVLLRLATEGQGA